MKLSLEQIKNIAFGAAYVEQIDEEIVLHRFTREQEELYRAVDSGFFNKAFATACITLEFKTDSASLLLKSHIRPRSSRTFFSHDIFVDNTLCGVLKGKFENDDDIASGKAVEGEFALGEKRLEKSVRIHLPWSCSSDIIELSLDDGATLIPVKKSCKMIFFGDSITQGYDAENTSNSYASRVMLTFDAEARNKGIGGEIFRPELARLADAEFEPDIVTVAYGTNDWSGGITRELLKSRADDFLGALAKNYPSAKIFVIAPIWRADHQSERTFGEFAEIKNCFAEIIKKYPNILLIDGFNFVPHDCELFSDKSLHPSDEGFLHYANNLIEKMKMHV